MQIMQNCLRKFMSQGCLKVPENSAGSEWVCIYLAGYCRHSQWYAGIFSNMGILLMLVVGLG